MWFIYRILHLEKKYCLHINLPQGYTLAAHHAEPGVHYFGAQARQDYPLLPVSGEEFLQDLPQKPIRYGWGAVQEVGEETIGAAKTLSNKFGYAGLQVLNEGYLRMTKSWICNLGSHLKDSELLASFLFVATDRGAFDGLTKFVDRLEIKGKPVVVLDEVTGGSGGEMSYGEDSYVHYMRYRTGMLLDLLNANVTLFLVESDAVWLGNPLPVILPEIGKPEVDMITASDGDEGSLRYTCGFQIIKPNLITRRFWRSISLRQSLQEAITQKRGYRRDLDESSEMLMVWYDYKDGWKPGLPRVSWLSQNLFLPGNWYFNKTMRTYSPTPIVIQNNYVIGNSAKITRAKIWKHWFLDENEIECTT